jgi:hypothetical protein
MKFCSQCRYGVVGDVIGWCHNPALMSDRNPVTGIRHPALCRVQRSKSDLGCCGPKALYFKPYPPPLWRRIGEKIIGVFS